MKWISVNKSLPEIPEGKYGISVLCSLQYTGYEQCSPGYGSHVSELGYFKNEGFGYFGENGEYPILDIITHWMYMPEPFQVTDEGFTFNPKDYNGWLPESLIGKESL